MKYIAKDRRKGKIKTDLEREIFIIIRKKIIKKCKFSSEFKFQTYITTSTLIS